MASQLDIDYYPDIFGQALVSNSAAAGNGDCALPTGFIAVRDSYIDEVQLTFATVPDNENIRLGWFKTLQSTTNAGSNLSGSQAAADLARITQLTSAINTGTVNKFRRYIFDQSTFLNTTAAATGYITVAAGGSTAGDTIQITDTAGVTKTYKAVSSGTNGDVDTDGTIKFVLNSTQATEATNLAAAINDDPDGHGASITASASSATVTLVQDVAGTSGNTAIVCSATDDHLAEDFSGGRDADRPGFIPEGAQLYIVNDDGFAGTNAASGSIMFRTRAM